MKKIIIISIASALLCQTSFARNGENDTPGNGEDGRNIVCTETASSSIVLQFMSTQLKGEAHTADFDLLVKARGDDVAEINLFDRHTGDSVRAKALEELLKITLTTGEGTAPSVVETTTHRGAGDLQVIDVATQDKATVKSLSRQGESYIDVTLIPNETAAALLNIICRKTR